MSLILSKLSTASPPVATSALLYVTPITVLASKPPLTLWIPSVPHSRQISWNVIENTSSARMHVFLHGLMSCSERTTYHTTWCNNPTLCGICPLDRPPFAIWTDSATAFKSLINDELLTRHNIKLEIGHAKNDNKNSVAERAIEEIEEELLRQDPNGTAVSSRLLAVTTATRNARNGTRGLSTRDIWIQRDQFANSQIPVVYQALILNKHKDRLKKYPYSKKSTFLGSMAGLFVTARYVWSVSGPLSS